MDVTGAYGAQSPEVFGQQHVVINMDFFNAYWSSYVPYSRTEIKVSSNMAGSNLCSPRFTVPNPTSNPTPHPNIPFSGNKWLILSRKGRIFWPAPCQALQWKWLLVATLVCAIPRSAVNWTLTVSLLISSCPFLLQLAKHWLHLTQAFFLTAVLKTSCNNLCPSGFERPVLALPVASAQLYSEHHAFGER